MATATRITGKQTPPVLPSTAAAPVAERPPFLTRTGAWINAHRQIAYWVGAVIVVAAGLFVWSWSAKRRTEEVASRALQGARFAFDNQNLPFAASELAKVIADYDGTNAAEEARIVLANVRLMQGQPNQAITVLKDFAPRAGVAFRSQAYGLLGAAYENLGRFRDAGEAYESGSAAARMDFQKAQSLADAGRAWTFAGDTAKAVSAYRRIVKDFEKQPAAAEAKVRLGELTKGTAS